MNDRTNPPTGNGSDDLLLRRYAEANALDDARPSPAVREAVLAQARVQAAAHAQALKATAETPTPSATRPAANDSAWTLRALGSLAVLGLVGLLVLQFDRGSPDERELALGRPSASTAQEPAAPATARAEIEAPSRKEEMTTSSPTPEPNASDNSTERSALAKTAPVVRPELSQATPQPKAASPAPAPPAALTPSPAAARPAPTLPQEVGTTMARPPASDASADVTDAASAPAAPASSAFPDSPAAQSPAANETAGAPDAAPAPKASPSAQGSLARAPTRALSESPSINDESATSSTAESTLQAKRLSPPTAAALGRSRAAAPDAPNQASDASAERLSEVPAISPDSALLAAAARGSLPGVREALAQGADVNHARQPDGRTALMLAAQRGDVAMVRLLIDQGADLQRLDRDGLSAADWARRAGQLGVLPLLVPAPGR